MKTGQSEVERDMEERTPYRTLLEAAMSGTPKKMEELRSLLQDDPAILDGKLIELGKDVPGFVNLRDRDDNTILHLLAAKEKLEVMSVFAGKGFRIDADAVNKDVWPFKPELALQEVFGKTLGTTMLRNPPLSNWYITVLGNRSCHMWIPYGCLLIIWSSNVPTKLYEAFDRRHRSFKIKGHDCAARFYPVNANA
ncbi:hypothetical protein AAC387_Pa07g0424 [Persea americana]